MKQYSPYSDLKAFYHTDRIQGLIEGKRVAPVYLRIKPTNVCNQRCYYCVYADDQVFDRRELDHRESIPWEIMQGLLNDLKEMGTKAITFSGGGEPLCYKHIVESFELAQKNGLNCSLISNGQALNGDVVDFIKHFKWLRVSFDSAKSETYESVRKVKTHQRVVDNLANFAAIKDKECTLGINCVVTEVNAEEIYDICKLVKSVGADNIKLSPILIKEDESGYHDGIKMIVEEQIKRAKDELQDENFVVVDKYTNDLTFEPAFKKKYKRCWMQELFCVVAADSKVYRCHQRSYMDVGRIGDLKEKSFKNIWYDENVINEIREFDAYHNCDFRCAFEERNELLNSFFNMDLNHVNFV